MGKPFKKELAVMSETLSWVEQQNIIALHGFLCENPHQPLIAVGSGGSYSACHYASLLYNKYCGMGMTSTPLGLQSFNADTLCSSKLLFISANGRNKDILLAFKQAKEYGAVHLASFSTTLNNPLQHLCDACASFKCIGYDIPNKKDGFLATNTLLAFFALLYKAYHTNSSSLKDLDICNSYELPFDVRDISKFIVIFGRYGEPVAYDIESKFSEAALGSVLLSDFRNFGHGRHHWFDKQRKGSCIVCITSHEDEELADKTIKTMPADIPVIRLASKREGVLATIELLTQAFRFVEQVGNARGIDPGQPGVPNYGTQMYNLNYATILKRTRKKIEDSNAAILRKLHVPSMEVVEYSVLQTYSNKLLEYVNRLNAQTYSHIVFDYDGTLNQTDKILRYSSKMDDRIVSLLVNLLERRIHITIVSGRGGSLKDTLVKNIPQKYWTFIDIGQYNGTLIRCLNDCAMEKDTPMSKQPLAKDLETLIATLKEDCPWLEVDAQGKNIKENGCQLTIKNQRYPNEVRDYCEEIILSKGLDTLHLWVSSHSMDVVISKMADKRNAVTDIDGTTLCIGDCGDVKGNDYLLLSTQYSLSVDKVSYSADSCWNIAPAGKRGLEATIFYLRQLILSDGTFKTNFKI
jgi:hypothetical protein